MAGAEKYHTQPNCSKRASGEIQGARQRSLCGRPAAKCHGQGSEKYVKKKV
jgi:hypothetical protein